nr:hypothetical protein [Gemmatales bacterium]
MRKICCVLTLIIIQASQVYSQFPQESLTRLPDWANALVIMDYQGILSSPIAQREGWDRVSPMEAIGSSLPCMRNTKYVIQGAKMEAGGLRSQRDIVLLQGGPFPTIEELMKQEKGIEETIANVRGLQTGKNAYLFSFSEKELAVCSPANRQEAARWLRFAQSNKQAVLSPYLVQASEAMKDGYHVVIALDLSDAMDQHLVRRFLQHTPILKSKQVDMDALVRVLTGSRGIRVGIRFDKTIQASLAADFSEEVQGFSSVLPSLVISSLNNLGGELYDFPVD